MNEELAARFMRYVQIDTEADPSSVTYPSSEKQKDLGELLKLELIGMGASEVEMDQWGYVLASVPATSDRTDLPTLCFCAHMDTAPDCSGHNVQPILHRNWDGSPIILPHDTNQVLSLENEPYLFSKIGQNIITGSGLTLLGADITDCP